MQAFYSDGRYRAGKLVRLVAGGVVVHLADGDERLRPLLGNDLYRQMNADVRGIDANAHAILAAALQDHSSWAYAQQLTELPLVSILLATKRPKFLAWVLDSVARQTDPNLELVLVLHGEGFEDIERHVAELPHRVKVLRISASESLGTVLNTAVETSNGTLLTKMDDDDMYGTDHL